MKKRFKNTLIQITQNGMGQSGDILALKLMTNYLTLLNEEEHLPRIIAFYHQGVKLLSKESVVLKQLIDLEENGVTLLACKTCINHFELENKIGVGQQGSMMDIVTLQGNAEKVITL